MLFVLYTNSIRILLQEIGRNRLCIGCSSMISSYKRRIAIGHFIDIILQRTQEAIMNTYGRCIPRKRCQVSRINL